MPNFFKNTTFDLNCPKCQGNISIKFSSVGNTINCPHCNQVIKLQDNGFNSNLQKVNKSLENFSKKFK